LRGLATGHNLAEMHRPTPWLVALAALAAFVATPLHRGAASVLEALDLDGLVQDADEIVLGTVTDRQSRWEGRRIVTDVTLRVEEGLEGEARKGSQMVLTHLGGSVGEVGMHVTGMPRLEVRERALVFAERRARFGGLAPVGLSQGVLRVRRQNGAELVVPGGQGSVLVRRDAAGRLLATPGALAGPRPLEEVLRDVRTLVQRKNAR
jgi:hypothetical protein